VLPGWSIGRLWRLSLISCGVIAACDAARGPHLILIGLLVIGPARASLQARIGHTRARIGGTRAPEPDGLTDRDLRRDLNAAENAELARLYDDGTISQATRQQLQHSLDL